MDNVKIGLFLQSLRKEKGITQNELAENFGISNKTVSKWECGDALPEIPLLKGIAEYYGVTVDEILNGERKNAVKEQNNDLKEEGLKKDSKFNLEILISLSFNFLMFIIGISVGFGATNGLAAGLIGLIGSAISIVLYFVLAYVFDRDFYNNIGNNKKSFLYVIAINLFIFLISVVIISLCSKNSMITFKYLFVTMLKLFSIYGFAVLLIHHIMISDNRKDKRFIFITIFLSVMLILGIYLNYVYIYQYIGELKYTGSRVLFKYSFYDNLGKSSSFAFLYLPLLLTISTIIVSYFVVSNKIDELPLYIMAFISLIFILFSQIYIWFDNPEPFELYFVDESRMYVTSFFTYILFILYIVFVYVRYLKITKKVFFKFLNVMFLLLFIIATNVVPNIFDPFYNEELDTDIGIIEIYTNINLGIIIIIVHVLLYLLIIYTCVLYIWKNKNILFSYFIHFINIIIFFVYLYIYNQKYNGVIEDMVIVLDLLIIIIIAFYLIISSVIIKHKKKEKEI